jgi:signal transduction histidine kinase
MARLDPETELRGESVKLRNLFIDVASAAASDAIAKNLELVVSDGPELEIHGNPAMLRILARNLLDNAISYTPAKGFVHISIGRAAGALD